MLGLSGLLINNGFSKTLVLNTDSAAVDSISSIDTIPPNTPKSSPNAPKFPVKYQAEDSVILDNLNNRILLYNNAKVNYEAMELTADTIIIYLDRNEVCAKGGLDSLGKPEKVNFVDGDESFQAPEMCYNFKTQKGKIYQVVTQEDESYLLAKKAKKMPNDDIFIQGGRITTCDADTPHFYFESSRLKVKPGKFIVSGPTHVVIRKIHTPLWLPFGYFPTNPTRKSGILIPSQATDNGQLGLRELGFHWAINDYVHADFKSDFFFSGLFRASADFNYKVNYKYDGNFGVQYTRSPRGTKGLEDYSISEDFKFNWTYRQSAKAHPKRMFTINIDAKTPGFNQTQNLNSITAFNSVQSYNRSNLSWSWREKWGSFSVTSDLNQDFANEKITMRAPEMVLRMNNRKLLGALQMSGQMNFQNRVTTGDSTFFSQNTIDEMQNGLRTNINLDLGKSYPIGPLNFSFPSLNINGYLNPSTIRKFYDDSLGSKSIEVEKIRAAYDMSFGNFGVNTKLFGTYKFKDGMYIKGLRHTFDPSVRLSWRPDFFIDWQDINRQYFDSTANTSQTYSIYEESVFRPTARKGLNLNYSLNNVLQAKVRQQNDSSYSYKKVNVIQAFNLVGSYNFLADSLKWSNMRLSFNANPAFLENFNADATFSPYKMDSLGNSINQLLWKENQFGRLTNLSIRGTMALKRKMFAKKDKKEWKDPDFGWDMNIGYTFNYSKPRTTSTINNTLMLNGSVSMNQYWSFTYRLPVNLEQLKFANTSSLGFRRDLHCWEVIVDWLPFNSRLNYTFTIRPKAGLLRDVKYEKRANPTNSNVLDF